MRFLALLDTAPNRPCQPISFVSSTVSNNFSSACYSRREYQTAIIRFLTSHFSEQSLLGCRSGITAEPSHTVATASSASSLGTWTQICEQSDYVPASTIVSGGQILMRLPSCVSAGLALADKSLCLEDSLASGGSIYLLATPCPSIIPPRNNTRTRSCWTCCLSSVTFAP